MFSRAVGSGLGEENGQDGEVTFAFIRHGQTDWNRDLRMQGASDIPLNDTGRMQAAEAVAGLRNTQWDAIVSSPLSRARETAEIIARGLSIPLGPAYDNLVERNYGEAEGATAEDIAERWPDQPFPGLERIDLVIDRGIAALEQISADYGDANVVIVCHGTLIRHTLQKLARRKFDAIRNGSIAKFDRVDSGWHVLTVNDEAVVTL